MAELTPQADAQAHSQPQIIVTDAYLNDPLQFTEDILLTPETLLQITDIGTLERDDADFLMVSVGANKPQRCAITMVSAEYSRNQIERQIDKSIQELLNG
jgi:hypothetical protein